MPDTPFNNTLEHAKLALAEGVPSLLPDSNRFKRIAEDHRWGRHDASCYHNHAFGCAVLEEKSRVR